jgi:hypothetical protein
MRFNTHDALDPRSPRPVSPLLRGLLVGAIFLALVPLLGLTEVELKRQRTAGVQPLPREVYMLPPPQALRALSFGYNEVASDLLWIRTVAYFADHLTTDHDLRYLQQHLSNVLELNPYFHRIYNYGASMMMSRGNRQTNDHVLAAINLLERGHKLFPNDWRMPFHIGAYYMGDLRSKDKEQRARWRRQAADWVRRASLVGAKIAWLPSLAAQIYSEQGRRDLAIRHLKELYLITQDEEMKRQIAAKLKSLNAAQVTVGLKQATEDLVRSRQQEGLSFVHDDLYILLRQPPLEPFSLDGALRAVPER